MSIPCDKCQKTFTQKTLNKYGGKVCGRCHQDINILNLCNTTVNKKTIQPTQHIIGGDRLFNTDNTLMNFLNTDTLLKTYKVEDTIRTLFTDYDHKISIDELLSKNAQPIITENIQIVNNGSTTGKKVKQPIPKKLRM